MSSAADSSGGGGGAAGGPPRELKRSLSSYQRAKESVLKTWDTIVNMKPEKMKMIKVATFFVVSVVTIERYGEYLDIAVDS
jgi:hypothetical protein